jgi:DnaK suppressor protein
MATANTNAVAGTNRYDELKAMLDTRRRELVREVQVKIRDARTDSVLERDVLDEGESSEVDIQDAIGFALIQMKTETLDKIDAALRRLGEGTYGECVECGAQIAGRRLRALPFAVRCRDCEEARETVGRRERVMAERRGSSALFLELPTNVEARRS